MVPESVVPGGCSECVQLFAFLDLKQGSGGRPFRGIRSGAATFGWSRNRVRRHLGHLEQEGLVTVARNGNHKAEFVVHNPARGVARVRRTGRTVGYETDPPGGVRNGPTSGVRNGPTPQGTVGYETDPPPRSYRSYVVLRGSDLEESEDSEITEVCDVDVDELTADVAAFHSEDIGIDHLQEPAGAPEPVEEFDEMLQLIREEFGDDIEVMS